MNSNKNNNVSTPEMKRKRQQQKTKKVVRIFIVLFIVFFVICLLAILKIEIFHTFRGHDLEEYRENRYTTTETNLASRGTIYDRYDNPIATDVKEYKLVFYLDEDRGEGEYVSDPQATAEEVVEILGYEDDPEAVEYITQKLSADDIYQTYIGTYGEHVSLAQKSELDAASIDGLDYEEELERYYPYGDFASYLVGYTTEDEETGEVTGHIGVEEQQDGFLKSSDGETIKEVDNAGVSVNDNYVEEPTTDGVDVVTTIDPQMQTILQTEMDESLDGLEYDSAMTLIMDVDTGEVLAAYSLPSFNPNERDIENFVDPFTTYCFEPGSTIKSFTVASAMEHGVWDPNNTAQTGVRYDDKWGEGESIADYIYNISGMTWGTITWEQGFYFSSNTVMTHVQDAIGYDTFAKDMTDKYLFGTPIDSEYLQTTSCSYDPIYPLDYANTSFGQGMTTNVLQLARAYSIFGNEGDMVVPHYVKQLLDPTTGEVIYDSENDEDLIIEDVISEETASDMMDLLYNAVYYDQNKGSTFYAATGYRYGEGETEVAGKSGTAQISVNGVYDLDNLLSSFAGFAPADDPEIFVYTAVVNAGTGVSDAMGEYYTSTVDQVVEYQYSSKDQDEESETGNEKNVVLDDYVGMTMDNAQNELSDLGFEVYLIGTGQVTSQYPVAAQKVDTSQTIYLAGEDDYTVESLVGLETNMAQDICYLFDVTCNFNAIGIVDDVEVVSNSEYNISVIEPDGITDFDSSITTRKKLTDVTTNKKGE